MSTNPTFSVEWLRDQLDYDPSTGVFLWKVAHGRAKIGRPPTCINDAGYLMVGVATQRFRAHRLAWFYVHGIWPDGQIDHINCDKLDNRIANLRDTTPGQNSQNQRYSHRDSASGLLGVGFYDGRWRAQIYIDGKNKYLGLFDSAEAASAAYVAAKAANHEAWSGLYEGTAA